MKTMTLMLLSNIQPGATLARDVLDASGKCLLAAGTELSTKTLALLQRRGVKSVALSQENPLSAEQEEAWRQTMEQQLSWRFRQVQDDPHMQQLQGLLRKYRLGEQ